MIGGESARHTAPMNAPFAEVLLTTPRLRLRAVEPRDVDALFALHADPDAMRYWSTPPWADREVAVRTIDESRLLHATGSALRLAIELPESCRVIGTCSLFNIQRGNRRGDVGYMLARDCWGRGLMSEAFDAVIRYAFATLELNRLEADIDPRNAASARLLERMGFTRDGLLRERWIVGNEVCDTALYGLLRGEWQGLPQGAATG